MILQDKGTAPIIKNGYLKNRDILQMITKGGIPIGKNVKVIDEQGNQYEATYPKRARGLVKKGRARFVDENTICLACPPNEYLEEFIMEENRGLKEQAVPEGEMTVAYVLQQMEKIQSNMTDLNDSFYHLSEMEEVSPVGSSVVTKAEAFRDAIMARETTNQQLIAFYKNVYEDIRPRSNADERRRFIVELIKSIPFGPNQPPIDFEGIIEAAGNIDLV